MGIPGLMLWSGRVMGGDGPLRRRAALAISISSRSPLALLSCSPLLHSSFNLNLLSLSLPLARWLYVRVS